MARDLTTASFLTKNEASAILGVCAERGNAWAVQILLGIGADVHRLDDAPLYWAVKRGHLEVVKILLSCGANLHARDGEILRVASQNKSTGVWEEISRVLHSSHQHSRFLPDAPLL